MAEPLLSSLCSIWYMGTSSEIVVCLLLTIVQATSNPTNTAVHDARPSPVLSPASSVISSGRNAMAYEIHRYI
ncbi:hypothetical protein P7C71_g6526, partial [Lecanoromycetidae sp. Uapishka_2]